jgi:hypothetical protein
MKNPEQTQPTEYKIRIEFYYKKNRKFFNGLNYIIQNTPFKFGLKITNIDNKSCPKGNLKNLSFKSAVGGTISHTDTVEMSFPELNPGQEIDIIWPDPQRIILKDQIWIECLVEPESTSTTKFITHQYDKVCKKDMPVRASNFWGNGLSVRGELEQQQAKTNFLMFVLTLLVFLDGVWGLDKTFKKIFEIFGWFFSFISSIFINLSH